MYKLLITPLILILFSCSPTKINKQPNIIFIMSDDHAAQAVGAYNGFYSNLNPTPNIDQLAADGMLFKSAFCTNSICTPSRASIITGQYPQTNGILDLDGALDTTKQYLPIELKKLGYTTAVIGKWHLKNEPTHFDFYKVLPGQGKYFNPTFRKKGLGKWPDNKVKTEGHSSDVITNSTLNYLKRVDKSKPFFIMHHYKAPHGKFEFAPRYTDYLESTKVPEPASLYTQPNWGSIATKGKDNKLKDKVGSSVSARHFKTAYVDQYVNDSSLTEYEATSRAYQTYLKDYLRCVKGIDDNLGRLFSYLKEEGLWDNTIIVYTADQGFMLGAHDLIDKRWMYEESMQMPFIIHCPKMIDKGVVSDLLINNTDFAPTIIELAGGKAPNYMQGKSFIKTIKGKEEKNWRTTTYYRYWMHMIHHYVPAHLGIRSKDYKLILYYNKHYLAKNERNNFYWSKRYSDVMDEEIPVAWEFYDLKNDPQELNNKYNDPNYATIIHDMKEDLKQQRIELNETDKNYPALNNIIEQHWND